MNKLKTKLAGVELTNPIIAASGTVGYGKELSKLIELKHFGAISTKGTTLNPKLGNPCPRITETPAGMLNSVGLENPGIDHFLQHELPWITKQKTKIIINIAGTTIKEFEILAEKLNETNVDFIELNISCPNINENGKNFGSMPKTAFEVVKRTRKKTTKPLIVKLTPNTNSITEIAKATEAAGADAICLINTILAMRIDIETKKPALKNNLGGLSGPAIFPIALRMVWQVFNAVKIPIIGCGGINNTEKIIEMFMAGATAVQIGTVLFSQLDIVTKFSNEIKQWITQHNIKDLNEIVGCVKPWL